MASLFEGMLHFLLQQH